MYSILLAEDNGPLRNLITSVLNAEGYDVIAGGDAAQALSAARQRNGPIHLLCTNLTLAGVHGVALAEQLRVQHPETKVLLLVTDNTKWIWVDSAEAAERHPDYAVLRKPFQLDELTSKVKEILASPAS